MLPCAADAPCAGGGFGLGLETCDGDVIVGQARFDHLVVDLTAWWSNLAVVNFDCFGERGLIV